MVKSTAVSALVWARLIQVSCCLLLSFPRFDLLTSCRSGNSLLLYFGRNMTGHLSFPVVRSATTSILLVRLFLDVLTISVMRLRNFRRPLKVLSVPISLPRPLSCFGVLGDWLVRYTVAQFDLLRTCLVRLIRSISSLRVLVR